MVIYSSQWFGLRWQGGVFYHWHGLELQLCGDNKMTDFMLIWLLFWNCVVTMHLLSGSSHCPVSPNTRDSSFNLPFLSISQTRLKFFHSGFPKKSRLDDKFILWRAEILCRKMDIPIGIDRRSSGEMISLTLMEKLPQAYISCSLHPQPTYILLRNKNISSEFEFET